MDKNKPWEEVWLFPDHVYHTIVIFYLKGKSSEINQFKLIIFIGNNILLIVYLLDISGKNLTSY